MTNSQQEKVTINVSFNEDGRLIGIDEQNTSSTVSSSIIDKFIGLVAQIAGGTNTNDVSVEFDGDLNKIIDTLKSQNPGVNSPAIDNIANILQLGEQGSETAIKSVYKTLSPNDTIGTPYIDTMLELAVEHGNYGEEGAITLLKIREPEIERVHDVEIEINEFDSNYADTLKDYTEIVGFTQEDKVIIRDSENNMSLVVDRDEVIYDSGNQTIVGSSEEIAKQLAADLLTGRNAPQNSDHSF